MRLGHGLIFRFIQRMNLGRAISTFDFDVLKADPCRLFAAHRRLILPPEETGTDQNHEQQQADNAQNIVRQPHRLFNATQAVHITAMGIGAEIGRASCRERVS